jgi:FPC/CPF motif-containing protein YcgG
MSAPRILRRSDTKRIAPQGSSIFERRVREAFEAFVGAENFPCLPAKGVLRRREYELGVYRGLGSPHASDALATDLAHFAHRARHTSDRLTSYIAVFSGRAPATELAFERRLWVQLQHLHERDDPSIGWDPAVSSDPESDRFSFSMAGCALFVVGMHPRSSRLARRFRWPALVFNPHAQFERLRREGTFDRLRDVIRERDTALQGSPNPALADFGARSEARQYSGRDTSDAEWRCPFHPLDR